MFKIEKTSIPGCVVINGTVRADERGNFFKVYHEEGFREAGLNFTPVERYYSANNKNVIRGMHFQTPPYEHSKLVYCSSGSIIDLIVDIRKGDNFGNCVSLRLNPQCGKMVFIPPGCAHGFISLNDDTIVNYEVSSVYAPNNDKGILWSSFGYDWTKHLDNHRPVVSKRDSSFEPLDSFDSPF